MLELLRSVPWNQRRDRLTLTCIAGLLLVPNLATAQLNRYWSNNFSEEASLLSGAVVGGGAGASAVFYNPAIIAQIRDTRFTVNADVATLESYRWENVVGNGETIKSFGPRIAPSFTALLIKPKNNERLTYEVTVLTREEIEFDLALHKKETRNVFSGLDGEEIFDVAFESKSKYTNLWMGFGGAYELKNNFSLGVSGFLVAKSLSDNFILDINAFPQTDPAFAGGEPVSFFVSNFTNRARTKSFNMRLVGKLGMFWNYKRWGFGLSFTAPSINLFGNADVSKKLSFSNVPDSTGTVTPDFILVDAQQKVPVNYKDPGSVAIGVRYTTANERTNFYSTLEYFGALDLYKSISAETNPGITNMQVFDQLPNQDFLSQYYGAEQILNYAFGFKQNLSPVVNLLLGFRSDYNYLKDVDFSSVHRFNQPPKEITMDVLHVSGGAQINVGGSHFVLGLQWSGGSDTGKLQIANTDGDENDAIMDPPLQGPTRNDLNVFYRALSIIFGIDVNLNSE